MLKALFFSFLIIFSQYALGVATPDLSISGLSTQPLKGDNLALNLALDNTGADTGFFPYFRMIIPEELSLSSSNCELGSASVTQLTASTSIDPYNGEPISLATGETLIVILPPTGHLSPTQGTLNCSLNFSQTASAAVGTGFDVKMIEGIFALGDQPNGEARPCGMGDTVCDQTTPDQTITPQLIDFQVSSPATTVTGPNNPFGVSISGDLATGEALNGTNIVYSEVISEYFVLDDPGDCSNISFTGPTPVSCSYVPNGGASLGGGALTVDYGISISADFTISYSGYLTDLDDSSVPAIDPTTGVASASQTVATFSSDETGILNQNISFNQRSIETNKSRSIFTDTTPTGFSPGDQVLWIINTKVSDYFRFENYNISDVLGDGLQYINGSLNVTIIEDTGSGSVLNEADLISQGHLVVTPNGDGTTDIDLNLGAAMADPFFGLADGVLQGASTHPTGNVTTEVIVTYRSDILDDYATGTNTNVDAGARLENQIDSLTMDLLHETPPGSSVAFSSPEIPLTTAFSVLSVTTFAKSITHINGAAPGAPPFQIRADDLVTFKVSFTLPTGGMEGLKITDFVPSPIFAPNSDGACLTFDGVTSMGDAPVENQWNFDTNDIGLASTGVTVNCSIQNGSVELSFADTDVSGSNLAMDVLFTLRANNQPIADGLQIVNSARLEHKDEVATATTSAAAAASFETAAPVISIDHTVQSSTKGTTGSGGSQLNNAEAGAVVTFSSILSNTGNGTAQSATHELLMLPDGFVNPNELGSCAGAACGYNISFTGDCGAPVFTASDEDTITITGLEILEGDTCEINYDLLLDQSVQPDEEIEPEIRVTWNNGGASFAPKFAKTNTEISRPSSSLSMTSGSDQNGAPGDSRSFDVDVVIPEGTTENFRVRINELDSFVSFDHSSSSTVTTPALTVLNIGGTDYYCSAATPIGSFDDKICFENDPTDSANLTNSGNNFTIDLGRTVNGFDNVGTDESFVFTALGTVNQTATDGNKRLRSRLLWSNPNGTGDLSRNSSQITFVVNSPKLVQEKCVDSTSAANAPFDLNESLDFIVKIKNTGSNLSTAYDISNITDSIMSGVTADTGSLEAYYCSSGASSDTCSSWPPTGCTSVSPTATGNIDIPIVGLGGDNTIEADGFFAVKFTANLNCSFIADTASDPTTSGSHPGSATGGLNCVGPETPIPFGVTQITNSTNSVGYSSLDGVISGEESYTALGDSISPVDVDHDGDGISTSVEGSGDTDGDLVPDYLDTDSDDNGITDSIEGSGDNDGDGTLDFQDTDDDGDGTSDAQEILDDAGSTTNDTDGDGVFDYLDSDSDGDGIADGSENAFSNGDTDSEVNGDDRDSDNDGIPDLIEMGLGSCDDGSGGGISGNGILEPGEIANCSSSACIAVTCDDDGNGAIEADEFVGGLLPDADLDGVPNAYDFDSDNDGLPDFYENLLGQNSISLGVITLQDITDTIDQGASSVGDGFIIGDTTPSFTGEILIIGNNIGDEDGVIENSEVLDTDLDGIPNYLDTDSDNDGIPDIVENNRASFDETGNSNGSLDYGAEYNVTADTNFIGPDNQPLLDTDSDGIYNYIDIDSDNDGLGDWIEAWPSDIDVNSDGEISASEFLTAVSSIGNNDSVFTSNELVNTDGQDLADVFDTDSDNDSILDEHESDNREPLPGNVSTVVLSYTDLFQSDGDSDPDFRDTDSDGDGIDDSVEAGDANPSTPPIDSDSDGVSDASETDSDNDGLPDADELIVDPSGISKTNPDTDGDMCNDGCEVLGDNYSGPGVCPYAGQPWATGGSAASPITNILDPDTDDGGANDCDEANDSPPTNPTVGNGGDDAFNSTLDSDMDGLTDFEEQTITNTDPFNAFSDSDTLHDGCEVLGAAVVSTIACPITGASGTVNSPYINPLNPDTDGGGIPDDVEVATGGDPTSDFDDDTDGDGIGNLDETNLGLDPNSADSNNDCLNDGDEIGPDINNPLDTDGDGILDIFDIDNDNDGLTDCEELRIGSNPFDNSDIRIQGSGGCGLEADASTVRWSVMSSNLRSKVFSEILMLFMPILLILGVRRSFVSLTNEGGEK